MKLTHHIKNHRSKNFSFSWNNIKEEAPDEIDLQMLKEIEADPECREFTKESDINWNERN